MSNERLGEAWKSPNFPKLSNRDFTGHQYLSSAINENWGGGISDEFLNGTVELGALWIKSTPPPSACLYEKGERQKVSSMRKSFRSHHTTGPAARGFFQAGASAILFVSLGGSCCQPCV